MSLAVRTGGLALGPETLAGFTGIRVVPDTHGDFDGLEASLAGAAADGRYVVQLGDLIDRGPYSPLCVERMLEIEAEGLGRMVPGNHEIAFARFVREGVGGAVTRQATLVQFEEHGDGLVERYVARILEGPLWLTAAGHLFAHAAYHPRMSANAAPDEDLVSLATHGLGTSKERRAGHLARAWVDAIPAGLTVVVGHAVTASRALETATGRQGGRAVFADTGAWLRDGAAPDLYDIAF